MTSKQVPWRKVLAGAGLVIAAAAVAALALYVVFWPLSDLIARHDVGAITGLRRAAALQTARDAARGRLVAFGAGLFAAGALIYTARNYSLSQQGQVTDRYTKAIDQLGPDKGLDVRIGGIYALERIARDSPRDHPTIMEVLGAFIREHSGEQWPPGHPGAEAPEHKTRPDVQAAVTVIGRRTVRYDNHSHPIDLAGADLAGADLAGADLAGADLAGAKLVAANLTGADLAGAKLLAANLARADLSESDLTGVFLALANLKSAELGEANLTRANLSGADLTGALSGLANFTCADLSDADLTNAKLSVVRLVDARLSGANLTGAFLVNADLTGAFLVLANFTDAELTAVHLAGANLTDALWPGDAEIPEGWRRDTDSGRLKPAGNDSGDTTAG